MTAIDPSPDRCPRCGRPYSADLVATFGGSISVPDTDAKKICFDIVPDDRGVTVARIFYHSGEDVLSEPYDDDTLDNEDYRHARDIPLEPLGDD